MAVYKINKGINKPIEFKGLKAQYIGYLAGGLVLLLISFAALYVMGVPVYGCIFIIGAAGGGLFYQVFSLSQRYGQHGLMKRRTVRFLPGYLKFNSRKIFIQLKR